ncbi:hypothetical protein P8452_67813 [Trifolium repens]|nr:hypothetical protein P8452_67813 [Trifolium repens]
MVILLLFLITGLGPVINATPLSACSNCGDFAVPYPLSTSDDCGDKSICRQFEEKVKEGNGCMRTLCCHYLKDSAMNSHKIRLRFGSCTAYTCLVDFKADDPIETWNYGIELQWIPPKY